MSASADFDVIIIGAGFAGIGLAIRLEEEGGYSYTVLEKEQDVGGTWYVNTYPGCACDIPSHLYSYSFAPNPGWSRRYSGQEEIWSYVRACADRFGVRKHIRCATEVSGVRFLDDERLWRVETAAGDVLHARFVVTALGGLSVPRFPDVEGLDSFTGNVFHSQQWDHEFALSGKRVAVIGTGASAIQFVPQIASRVGSLTLFQRTPPWIIKKYDRNLTRLEQAVFRSLPFTQWLNRTLIYWLHESRAGALLRRSWLLRIMEWSARRHMRKQIDDPALAERLVPDYRIGCKRILLSNDFYPALNRPNVRLVDHAVTRIEGDTVISADGARHQVDALILATGFKVADLVPRGFILGRDGRDIVAAWADGPEAYLGTVVAGFPNLFIMAGPNTSLGHNSMIYMLEAQMNFVLSALGAVAAGDVDEVDVRDRVQADYNSELQSALSGAVWQSGCRSWYQDRHGKNVAIWPGHTWQFRRRLRRINAADFRPRDSARRGPSHAVGDKT